MASTTTHDDGFHEIQLNGKQMVFLFMAGTVVAVVIFLCGVLVGRGVQLTPADPLGAAGAVAAVTEPPAVPLSTGSEAPESTKEDLTYPARLAGTEAPREELRNPPPPAPRPDAPPPATRPDAAPAKATPAPAVATVKAEPSGDGFAIQVAALRERSEADTIVKRLTAKGYAAYVMAPARGAPSVFRVRVGKFKERREAESVSTRLQKEEQFKPWIVR